MNGANLLVASLENEGVKQYESISLSDWLTHTPPAMVAADFNLSPKDIAKFAQNGPVVLPV
jgi:oxalate decarboxylase